MSPISYAPPETRPCVRRARKKIRQPMSKGRTDPFRVTTPFVSKGRTDPFRASTGGIGAAGISSRAASRRIWWRRTPTRWNCFATFT